MFPEYHARDEGVNGLRALARAAIGVRWRERRSACAGASGDLSALDELLLLAEGHCLRDQALSVCGRGRRKESPFGATSLATLTQMVAVGRGVTLLPELALATENRRGQLTLRRFKQPQPGRTLALAWRRGSAVAAAARALADTIRARYRQLSDAASSGRPSTRRS